MKKIKQAIWLSLCLAPGLSFAADTQSVITTAQTIVQGNTTMVISPRTGIRYALGDTRAPDSNSDNSDCTCKHRNSKAHSGNKSSIICRKPAKSRAVLAQHGTIQIVDLLNPMKKPAILAGFFMGFVL
jgi:hypothetical protein